ncbi:MAG: 4'-phosphopantetheinyl transferase superfamily protein [Desulfobacterales bacterium]|jgi:4'-phosphopantetheinyl transferase
MNTADSRIAIYPVVLKVPKEKEALKGREKVRFLSDFARVALRRSAARLGVDLPKLEKRENGAPVPTAGTYWSIAHKSRYVAAVAAPRPVGIDIEQIRPFKDGLAEKIGTPEEWGLFPGDRRLAFFRCWTAKEAVLKGECIGIAGLSGCRIVSVDGPRRLLVVYQERTWTVDSRLDDEHLTAVAGDGFAPTWTGPGEER